MNTPTRPRSNKPIFDTIVPDSEYIKNMVRTMFARNGDVIVDTCILCTMYELVIQKALRTQSELAGLEASITFIDEFNANLPLYQDKTLIFPELYIEYEKTLSLVEKLGKRAVDILHEQSAQTGELCSKIESYCRRARRLKQLAKRYCRKAEFDPAAEQFKDLLLYLNQRFEWKDEDSTLKTDEKISAYSIINSMLNSPTTVYSQDGGVASITREAISFLTARTLMTSEHITPQALEFMRRLKRADVRIRKYNHSKPEFFVSVDNVNGIQLHIDHAWFPPRLKLNAPYIIRRVSEDLTDIANSEYFKYALAADPSERLK